MFKWFRISFIKQTIFKSVPIIHLINAFSVHYLLSVEMWKHISWCTANVRLSCVQSCPLPDLTRSCSFSDFMGYATDLLTHYTKWRRLWYVRTNTQWGLFSSGGRLPYNASALALGVVEALPYFRWWARINNLALLHGLDWFSEWLCMDYHVIYRRW